MPVAAVDEDHRGSASQDEIRTAGQTTDVQAVPIAQPCQDPSDDHFWRGVPAADACHQPASVFRR